MCANATIDCIAAYFPYKSLNKIIERPTYDSLKTLKKMVKANASFVISDTGGGQQGHLGLVIPNAEYNRITGCTYNKPSHPGNLKIHENTLIHEAIIMRELHNKKLNLFREKTVIKSAIKSQIVAAIDPIYHKELKNSTMETIKHTILQILMHCFQQYGQVPYHLSYKEEEKYKILYAIPVTLLLLYLML